VDGPIAIRHRQRFDAVGSTNDVVREWLADGLPEICLAVADVQSEGRGRAGRRWDAPSGAALLLSAGFRPIWLPPERAWRLTAITSLAMVDAAEEAAGLPDGTIRLKWPNDLVVETAGPGARPSPEADPHAAAAARAAAIELRKLGGVLGETDGLATADPRVVVGIGIDVDWPEADFPEDLQATMTSLRAVSGGRPVDREELLERFTDRLEVRSEALRQGYFDVAGWVERQATTGRDVTIVSADGSTDLVHALGVDALSGALIVDAPMPEAPDGEGEDEIMAGEGRPVYAGEVTSVRIASRAGV
jgi:BirA family biotin operon repressor/biotin-[acetyl-CoA-carboxylase] ligase